MAKSADTWFKCMSSEALRHFRYEIALGAAIPMPKPPYDYFPNSQFCLQQFLHALCKENVGTLGKKEGRWSFGPEAPESVRLASKSEVVEYLNLAAELGIIEPAPSEGGDFTPYKLSERYWTKFDKFAG